MKKQVWYIREKWENKMIVDELNRLFKIFNISNYWKDKYIKNFMTLYNSKSKKVIVNSVYDESYHMFPLFKFFEYKWDIPHKTIVNKTKVYGCDDKCNECILCIYGYTIDETNDIIDSKRMEYHTENMRKDLLCVPLIRMILARFRVPKDIRNYICLFLRKPYK